MLTHPRNWSDTTLRRLLLINLIAQIGIVVTGGLVRVTGSGLGCPTWPECVPGSYVPVVEQAEGLHKWIEFGNRTLTGAVSLTAILAIVAAVQLARRGYDQRIVPWSVAVLGGVGLQAIIGGITVLTGLNPWTVAAHFMGSMVLVAASIATLELSYRKAGPRELTVRREVLWLAQAISVLTVVILVLGTIVTGSGPHSGDAETPARTGFDPRAMSWLHADAVLVFVGLVLGFALLLRVTNAPAEMRHRATQLIAVTLVQGLIGYVQYATGLPEALVVMHMLGASLLVVAVVRVMIPLSAPVDDATPAAAHDQVSRSA